jgi:hypothetical protein
MIAAALDICLFETKTDNDGIFKISHDLGNPIQGIIASIQTTDENWHPFGSLDGVLDLYWNEDTISGRIQGDKYLYRPIKVVVFSLSRK